MENKTSNKQTNISMNRAAALGQELSTTPLMILVQPMPAEAA